MLFWNLWVNDFQTVYRLSESVDILEEAIKEATTQIYVLYIICLDTTELSDIRTHNFAFFYQYRHNHYHIALFDTALKSVYTSIYCGSVLVKH